MVGRRRLFQQLPRQQFDLTPLTYFVSILKISRYGIRRHLWRIGAIIARFLPAVMPDALAFQDRIKELIPK
jgi:hypothetical protein